MSQIQAATALQQDSQLKRFFNLWACVYVLIFILTSQFVPKLPIYEWIAVWTGKTFMHLKGLHRIIITGSGDTSFDYVLIFVNIVLSYFFSIIILVIDYKRKSYRQLYLFTIVIARYYVAYTMLLYGFAKIFDGQFGEIPYYRLGTNTGDMSPMGILWAFMGASRPYTFISGLLEFTGGVLLFFRKTKTFGALFSMTVMLNVALLNFTYDVPVKIFSTHIVLLCVFILTYDWKILFNFFVRHRTEKLDYKKLRVSKKWMQIILRVIKIALIIYILYINIKGFWFTLNREKIPLEGAYSVKVFIVNKKEIAPSVDRTDSIGWNKLFIDFPGSIIILNNDQKLRRYQVSIDTLHRTFDIKKGAVPYAFMNYSMNKDTLLFVGTINNQPAQVFFTRQLKRDFPLTNMGFHWINEYPSTMTQIH